MSTRRNLGSLGKWWNGRIESEGGVFWDDKLNHTPYVWAHTSWGSRVLKSIVYLNGCEMPLHSTTLDIPPTLSHHMAELRVKRVCFEITTSITPNVCTHTSWGSCVLKSIVCLNGWEMPLHSATLDIPLYPIKDNPHLKWSPLLCINCWLSLIYGWLMLSIICLLIVKNIPHFAKFVSTLSIFCNVCLIVAFLAFAIHCSLMGNTLFWWTLCSLSLSLSLSICVLVVCIFCNVCLIFAFLPSLLHCSPMLNTLFWWIAFAFSLSLSLSLCCCPLHFLQCLPNICISTLFIFCNDYLAFL